MHFKDTRAVRGSQARACPPNAQADAATRTRLKFAWLGEVNLLLREEAGRLACKTQKVSHRLVSDLAEELARYPSFARDAKVWVGQAKLAMRLSVHERQARRGVAVLVKLGVLRIDRASRGQRRDTNTMAAHLRERPLFEAIELCYGASTSAEDRTSASPAHGVSAPSNFNGDERKKDSSPPDPSTSEAVAPEAVPGEEQVNIGFGRSNGAVVSFACLMRDYPHPRGSLDQPAYRPSARVVWNSLAAEQQHSATQAASKAPGKQWLKYWLQDGLETGAFEVVERQPVSPRVWVREGTPQWNAWEDHRRANGQRPLKTQRKVEGEPQTGWMFETEWPPVAEQAPSPEACDE
jgi:hypothetical protein